MKKSIFTGLGILITGITIVLVSCVKEKPDAPPYSTIPFDPAKVVTIQDVKQMLVDSGANYVFKDIYSFYARVGMDEKSGNIYKTSYVQDATGGIQLNFLNTSGMYLGDSIRVMLRGGQLTTYGQLYEINNLDAGKNIYKLATGRFIEPKLVTLPELLNSNNFDVYQSTVVKLDSVEFANAELGQTYADSVNKVDVNRNLEDCDGNTIIVRTSGYANFANRQVASGKGSLIAIFTRYNDIAQLVIRSIDEVQLNDNRCGGPSGTIDPVSSVNEHFDLAANYTDINIPGWSNFSKAGNRKWQGKVFNTTDKYAQATGYNSGLADMETWLITPPVINTNGDMILSFKCAQAYWLSTVNAPITVLASTDYDGSNFETATWTPVSATLPTQNSPNYQWIASGDVSLASFTGNVAIAFKYKGSDAESTSIELDDVVIDNGGGSGITPVDEVNEHFDNAADYTDYEQTGWANLIVAGSRKWQGKTFNSGAEKYVQATGYNSGLSDMETWLITPLVINTNGDKVLTFNCAQAYWANTVNDPITVLASTDYDGTNFATATWTPLTANLPTQSSANYEWVASGNVPLASFTGNVAVAFKYKGSDSESTSIELDDVIISGGGGTGGDLINATFNSGWDNFETISVEGAQVWDRDNTFGQDFSPCARMSGYAGGNFANDDWLITPALNLAGYTSVTLTFETAKNYTGNDIAVKISSDYSGDPSTATWTALSATLSAGSWTWTASGNVDLSSYIGQTVYIGIQYTSTTSEGATWEVDNVSVTAE